MPARNCPIETEHLSLWFAASESHDLQVDGARDGAESKLLTSVANALTPWLLLTERHSNNFKAD
jgi:hypothetical protein